MEKQLYTVEEVARRFSVSNTFIRNKLIEKGYKKELIEQRYRYMISEEMVNKIFNIPEYNELDIVIPKIIYVNTIYEILPSKMNYFSLSKL